MRNIFLPNWLYHLLPPGLTLIMASGIVWAVQDHVFFWDTIQLGAKQASWYYEQAFRHLLLPPEIDSGHPPLFGMYLAATWLFFGQSLAASHWVMLPMVWGILWLAYRIGDDLGGARNAWFLPLLLLADPVFMGQAVLISPDLVLVFAFLLGFYGVLSRNRTLKIAGSTLLALISLRGMMCVPILYAFEVLGDTAFWMGKRSLLRQAIRRLPPYLPAAFLAAAFLGYHYTEAGWIGYHEGSPWAPSFERVDLQGFLRNLAILAWRMLDYGRVFECLALVFMIWILWKRRPAVLRLELLPWLLLTLIALAILSPSLLLHRHLSAHRYLLPFFITLHLLLFQLLLLLANSYRQRRWWLLPVLIGLASGNLWIYPRHIAQGWDATLAHLPYYELREQMLEFIEQKNLSLSIIGTVFPEVGPLKFRDLSDREEGMKRAEPGTDPYIFYASIMNDFTDPQLRTLHQAYRPLYTLTKHRIQVVLYIRTDLSQ